MGIVGHASERAGSPTVSGNLNARKYTRKFLVTTDSKDTGPMQVAAAVGIPPLYSAYQFGGTESDPFALLRNIECQRIADGSYHWEVTCSYETPDPVDSNDNTISGGGTKREQAGQQDNPLLMIPEIEVSFERFQQAVFFVYDTTAEKLTPCKASNGQIFVPPPSKDASRMLVTITRNEDITSDHPNIGIQFQDVVNSDYWFGQPPGVWKCQGVSAARQSKQLTINGIASLVPYLKVTYKFEARNYPYHDTLILDAGTFYLEDTGDVVKKKRQFLTDDGHPTTGPLDGHGDKLGDGEDPVFLPFRFYKRKPYSLLALPNAFVDFA